MAYSMVQQDNDVTYNKVSLVANTRADIETLPTKWTSGSDCLVIEDSSVWILTIGENPEDKIWKEI